MWYHGIKNFVSLDWKWQQEKLITWKLICDGWESNLNSKLIVEVNIINLVLNGNQLFVGNCSHFHQNQFLCKKLCIFFPYLLSCISSHSKNQIMDKRFRTAIKMICNFCLCFRKINFHVHLHFCMLTRIFLYLLL